jgi:Ras-related protein Rab-11A
MSAKTDSTSTSTSTTSTTGTISKSEGGPGPTTPSTTSTSVSEEDPYMFLFKLVLAGDSGVGKSSIMQRFAKNEFNPNSKSTIGVEFYAKTVELDHQTVKVQIWDTAGQERYRSITSAYYRHALAVLLVYDITKRTSFEALPNWLKEIKDHSQKENEPVIMVVGNKCDLRAQRQVSTDEGKEFCRQHNMFFTETSSLTAHNINIAFDVVIGQVYIRHTRKCLTRVEPTTTSGESAVTDNSTSISLVRGTDVSQLKTKKKCCT